VTSFGEGGLPEGNGHRAGRGARAADHDRRALRRAVAAGIGFAVVIGGFFAVGFSPRGGAAVGAGVLLGVACGAMVTALWSAVGIGLDVLADVDPSRHRIVWTGGFVALAVVLTAVAFAVGASL
jgi:hypothetical protein